MKRGMLLSGMTLAVALAVAPGFAAPPPDGPGEGHGFGPREGGMNQLKLARELGLTDEQTGNVRKMMYETRKKMIQLDADREAARMEIEYMMEADSPDEKAVLEAVEKLGQVNSEIVRNRIRNQLEMKKLLTPEQRAKFKGLRENMQERRGDRFHGQRGGGQFRDRNDRMMRDGPGRPNAPDRPAPADAPPAGDDM